MQMNECMYSPGTHLRYQFIVTTHRIGGKEYGCYFKPLNSDIIPTKNQDTGEVGKMGRGL